MSDDYPYRRPGASWARLPEILRELEKRPDIAPSDVDQANADMLQHGCRTRYRPDGTAFLLGDGDQDPARPAEGASRAA